jgi:predicted O-methyltransferase YrrM
MGLEYLKSLICRSYEELGFEAVDGSADNAELAYLARLARNPGVRLIGEIGFNVGYSSYNFLEANPYAHVYSFDLGEYGHVRQAKHYIDEIFPGRHTLILGNSVQTVPEFLCEHPQLKFDLIFIDGGHDYEVAKADLVNMRALATTDTILVTDDLTPWLRWGEGPTRAWQEALRNGQVIQEELVKDGVVVTAIEPPGERSWVVGRYK